MTADDARYRVLTLFACVAARCRVAASHDNERGPP
jgi:hypothetical protein